MRFAEAEAVRLGSPEGANQRTIYKYIHPGGIQSCQLVMGFTQLKSGSIWNTMPPHTHSRRMEVYLYFDAGAYSFCWGMGGENQAFDDMDVVGMEQLR
jgi:4-deoxy-L-threo-5-hexosulose-uronate ketol-isomerase